MVLLESNLQHSIDPGAVFNGISLSDHGETHFNSGDHQTAETASAAVRRSDFQNL